MNKYVVSYATGMNLLMVEEAERMVNRAYDDPKLLIMAHTIHSFKFPPTEAER